MSDLTTKIRTFFTRYPESSYRKEAIILRPDDPMPYVYYVSSGYIRMYTILPDGKEFTLNIFKPGSYFSMFLILGNSTNAYYYQTITPVSLRRTPKAEALTFIRREPDVMLELVSRISAGVNGLLSNLQSLLFGPAKSRVASILLILARRFGEQKDSVVTITLPLTHQDIGNLVGLTRETTSLEMEKLVARKIISYDHKHVVINDEDALADEVFLEDTGDTDGSL